MIWRCAIPVVLAMIVAFPVGTTFAGDLLGAGPRLGRPYERITQDIIEDNVLSLRDLRKAGLSIFATPFNRADGFGDGPLNPSDTTAPGGRPTLQGNGTSLRVNGLDAQACQECHGIVSTATIPPTLGIGGSGTTATMVMFLAKDIDIDDSDGNGFAFYDGRLIVPPHLFGVGGVQQVGKEMTIDLQGLKAFAIATPDTVVSLDTKGVNFGTIVADMNGNVDISGVEGVNEDLVIRPFGRKGEFSTVRQFDQVAMPFHMGMQPVEIVGEGVDGDGDGVVNEVLVGELSVLEIFLTTQNRPFQDRWEPDGLVRFQSMGCADCHIPELNTESCYLTYSFPEMNTDPLANVFYQVDLRRHPMRFAVNHSGGVRVPMFSDLKRHDMGDDMAESFQGATDKQNREFITAKLWAVADTAPYLHDGRAQTLMDAILMHGGEAHASRDNFAALSDDGKNDILALLRTLRTPSRPNSDIVPNAQRRREGPLD